MAEKKLPKGITKRKDGRYMGRFQFDGKSYTLYNTDIEQLKSELEDLRYEVKHGLYEKEKNITVNAWFKIWMEEYKQDTIKISTQNRYTGNYRLYIEPTIGKRKMKDVEVSHIQRLYNSIAKQDKGATLLCVRKITNGMFKQAYKNGIISRNPVERTTLPKVETEHERRVLTREEQELFMKYAKKRSYGDIFEIMLATGVRVGELCGLEWSDIDFNNRLIHITGTFVYESGMRFKGTPKTKTSKRDIPMLDNVYDILKNRQREIFRLRTELGKQLPTVRGLENIVFLNTHNEMLTPRSVRTYINGIEREMKTDGIEFEHIHPHVFRHTFATRCIENGIEPQVLKTIMGHSKLSMTMDLYSHVLPNTKEQELKKIANLF